MLNIVDTHVTKSCAEVLWVHYNSWSSEKPWTDQIAFVLFHQIK